MSDTEKLKATFGKKVASNSKNEASQKTHIVCLSNGIIIRVTNVSKNKTIGYTKVDFESKRKKDGYRKLNKMLEEG